jgi:hypothetical protein
VSSHPEQRDSAAENREAPSLAELLRWLTEIPAAFKAEPAGFPGGTVPVAAVVADLLETHYGELPDDSKLAAFRPADQGKVERNRLRWVLAACHLLWHSGLRGRGEFGAIYDFLTRELATLAEIVAVDAIDGTEERREELARRAIRALGLTLPGESPKDAEDRLTQLDSVEHRRLIRDASEREKRAREVREMMARRAAEEAAAKVSRE